MKVTVVLHRDVCGRFVARCLALPGCVATADTQESATQRIGHLARSYLDSLAACTPMTVEVLTSVVAGQPATAGSE